MRVELDWSERQLILDLLYQEEDAVKSGSTVYGDNNEMLELIAEVKAKLEDD